MSHWVPAVVKPWVSRTDGLPGPRASGSAALVQRYLREKVVAKPPAHILDIFLSPYYGWVIERLNEAIKPDAGAGEEPEVPVLEANRGPGSTSEVDFWTSKDVREVVKSHLNYVVADTKVWEQAAAYVIDTHPGVAAFVKNAGLGFSIPSLPAQRPAPRVRPGFHHPAGRHACPIPGAGDEGVRRACRHQGAGRGALGASGQLGRIVWNLALRHGKKS